MYYMYLGIWRKTDHVFFSNGCIFIENPYTIRLIAFKRFQNYVYKYIDAVSSLRKCFKMTHLCEHSTVSHRLKKYLHDPKRWYFLFLIPKRIKQSCSTIHHNKKEMKIIKSTAVECRSILHFTSVNAKSNWNLVPSPWRVRLHVEQTVEM